MSKYNIKDKKDTESFARELLKKIKVGDIICLTGDLGAGKTFLVKCIADLLGIKDDVISPTFNILKTYKTNDKKIKVLNHFDVYRISDPDEMYEIGFDDYIEGEGICFIEWAELIEEILPEERTEILIEKDLSRGYDYRLITIREVKQ